MSVEHTAGPWRVHSDYLVRVGPYNTGIDVGPSGRSVAMVIGEFEKTKPGAEAEANARLIAAAPTMLWTLKDIREFLKRSGYDTRLVDATIAKAESAVDAPAVAVVSATTLKEWPVDLWVVLRDGQPFDYAFSRAAAFLEAKRKRKSEPLHFWSVTPAKGTLSIKVPS